MPALAGLDLRLGLLQQRCAIAIERVELLQLAQRTDRLHESPGGEVLAGLLVELGLMVARLGWGGRRAPRHAGAALQQLAAIVGTAGREIAQHAVGLGDTLAAPDGVFTLGGRGIGKAVRMVFRHLLAIGAFDLLRRCRTRYSQELVIVEILEVGHNPPLGSYEVCVMSYWRDDNSKLNPQNLQLITYSR